MYDIITANKEKKVVVLSAVSGTTNTLVNIASKLSKSNKDEAQEILDDLLIRYKDFVDELYTTDDYRKKGLEIVNERFDVLRAQFLNPYSEKIEKVILAQGELISTNLFVQFLKEKEVSAEIIQALDFMSIDGNDEPEIEKIEEDLPSLLRKILTFKYL